MNQLLDIDTQLLLWINSRHAPWADVLFWYVSQPWLWVPLYVLLLFWLFRIYSPLRASVSLGAWQRWMPFLTAVAVVALAAGLSDFVTSGLLKHAVARLRPTHMAAIAEQLHILNGYTGGLYGFPSSHAANCCAVALSGILLQVGRDMNRHIRNAVSVILILYVLLNCYSRMYLGVHFPLDIICGAAIGALIAWFLILIRKVILEKTNINF